MQNYIDRLKEERDALAERINKLIILMDGSTFADLDEESKSLLGMQFEYMSNYYSIVVKRIKLAEESK